MRGHDHHGRVVEGRAGAAGRAGCIGGRPRRFNKDCSELRYVQLAHTECVGGMTRANGPVNLDPAKTSCIAVFLSS